MARKAFVLMVIGDPCRVWPAGPQKVVLADTREEALRILRSLSNVTVCNVFDLGRPSIVLTCEGADAWCTLVETPIVEAVPVTAA